MSHIKNWSERFQGMHCKRIQLQYTSNINHIKDSTDAILRLNITVFVCQRQIHIDNTIQLNPQLIMAVLKCTRFGVCYRLLMHVCAYINSFSVLPKIAQINVRVNVNGPIALWANF